MTTFRKRELLLYYGVAYLITAVLETILFTLIIGSWTFRDIILNFSIWGIIWLVSLFAYPMFFTDANRAKIALNPYLSLLGYAIIILVYYLTYKLHKKNVEAHVNKKLSFNRLIDLYFPVKKDSPKKIAQEQPDIINVEKEKKESLDNNSS